jgi:phage head maturation protease
MNDGVLNESSFTFTVAADGQDWNERDGVVTRTITRVSNLYNVCVCSAGAYPATDSGIARTLYLEYAQKRGFIRHNPDGALATARLKAELELRRRRANH